MNLGPLFISIDGVILSKNDRKNLNSNYVGGVILFSRNYVDKKQLKELINSIKDIKSPELIVSVDQEGGRVQRFINDFYRLPSLRTIGKLYDQSRSKGQESALLAGQIMSLELSEVGIDFSFAPVLDIDYGYSKIIGDRSFHSDPNVISELASSYIDGLKLSGMPSIGKHFPGHGGVILDSHTEMPIDDRGMNELINDIKPYVYLMNKHLDAIMTAHIHYPLIDESITTFSKYWLKTTLRQELGFNGLIFSDDLMMKAVNTELNMDEKINHALSAGCDFVLVCNMELQMSDLLDNLDLNINESEMSAKIDTLRCKAINKGMIKHSFRELTLKLNHLLDSL